MGGTAALGVVLERAELSVESSRDYIELTERTMRELDTLSPAELEDVPGLIATLADQADEQLAALVAGLELAARVLSQIPRGQRAAMLPVQAAAVDAIAWSLRAVAAKAGLIALLDSVCERA